MSAIEPANPVHMSTAPGTRWSTVNFAEAIQGVQKPLGWAMWSLSMETSVRMSFGAMGVLARSEVPVPDSAEDRISGIFYGRAAGNVDTLCGLGDRMPGSSGAAIEEKMFGKEPAPDAPSGKPLAARRRYPVVAVRMPRALRAAATQIPVLRREYREWWQRAVLDAPPTDLPGAQALYSEAADRFIRVGVHHATASLVGFGLLDQLTALAVAAGQPTALAAELATGYGAMEETELLEDLWSASRDALTLDELVRRHGYHGPDEGDLSNSSWREDRRPLESLIASYARSEMTNPREREATQRERRRSAEERVLAGLPAYKRGGARLTMKLASVFIPKREVGKAAFLHTLDAARCAAKSGGALLAEQGLIDDPADVFFLTDTEFLAPAGASLQAVVTERKERHERYRALVLPPEWTGPPVPLDEPADAGDDASPAGDGAVAVKEAVRELRGIGVVGDAVTGRARVIHDPDEAALEPGDILVCVTTDPSWTPLFMLADALVIDTGGQMSHGAIVARELGVTCVINTGTGTRDIPDLATITVDGSTGLVTIG
ncbi:MAG TPA: PEP-utilizing enzyme [Solirubrobacteraceae bacterium]|jgi:pyruvate,water dikinase|nr:PEP-utilizing enzyme [Solirubrobacteraceae bacterium]